MLDLIKIGHPWWHLFFTEWRGTTTGWTRVESRYFCTKCNNGWAIVIEDDEPVQVIKSPPPKEESNARLGHEASSAEGQKVL